MTRPPSIVAFERLYLGSIAVYVLNALIFWSKNQELMRTIPQVRSAPGLSEMMGPLVIATLAVTVLASVLFWFLTARKRSVVGKWLVVVTEAIGVLFAIPAIWSLIRGAAPNPPSVAVLLLSTALAVAAAAMLFRADARGWFGEGSLLDGRA